VHVVVITSLFPNPLDRCSGVFVLEMLRHYPKDVTVSVISLTPSWRTRLTRERLSKDAESITASVKAIDRVAHVPYFAMPRFLMPLSWPVLFKSVERASLELFQDEPPQLVHGHFLLPSGLLAAHMAKKWGIPSVCTCHGSDVNILAQRPYMKPWVRRALSELSAVIVVSNALGDRLRHTQPTKSGIPIHVIRNGYSPNLVSRQDTMEAGNLVPEICWGHDKVLLYVGRLTRIKRLDVLVKAFALMSRVRDDARLVIVGDGPERAKIERLAQSLDLREKVTMTGEQPNRLAVALMAESDMLVLSSDNEGTPVVIIEALSVGTPVISTNVGGIPEVVDEGCGILVSRRSAELLAQAMLAGLACTWDANRIRSSVSHLSWTAVAAETVGVYHTLCCRDVV